MKLFPIHILIKDLSFLIFYFIIMKYDLTNETFLPESIREFPGAVRSTFGDMILASIFYNWIPLIVSVITYYPIFLLGRKIYSIKNNLQILLIGFLLSITTPFIYIFDYKIDFHSMKNAEIIAWILTFGLSILTYFLFNRQKKEKLKI